MLRFALLADGSFLPSYEGATRRFIGLTRAMSRHGIDTTVFHAFRGWSDPTLIKNERFRTYLLPVSDHYDNVEPMHALIRKHGINTLVISEYVAMLRIGVPLKKANPDLHLVFEVHDVISDFLGSFGSEESDVATARRAEQLAFDAADSVVCFSRYDADRVGDLTELFAQDPTAPSMRSRFRASRGEKPKVMPFGVEDRAPVTRSADLTGTKIVLFVGNNFHEPNARAVEALFREVYLPWLADQPDIEIWIVGDAPPDLISACSALRFRFVGRVSDLDAVMSVATLAVAPIFHGSGVKTKVLDYAMAGLPVLCSLLALRGIAETSPQQAAFLVEDDIASYGPAIRSLVAQPGKLAKIGSEGRKVVEALTWQNVSGSIVEAYQREASSPLDPWDNRLGDETAEFVRSRRLMPYFLKDNIGKQRFDSSAEALDGIYRCGWGEMRLMDGVNDDADHSSSGG